MPRDDRGKRALKAYVQARMQREEKEWGDKRGYSAEVARKTGFSTAHIANAKNHGVVGPDFAKAIAAVWHMTLPELEAVALEEFDRSSPVLRLVERDERYPTRQSAAKLARDRFRVTDQAIGEILDEQNQFPSDPGEGYWVEQFIARQRVLDRLGSDGLPGQALGEDNE